MSSNQDPMYSMANSQNGIYPNMIHANNFDFISDMDPSKQQQQQLNTAKVGGYDAYRPFGYTTNTVRQRHQPNTPLAPQYRENYYQNPSEIFSVTPSLQLSASAYDYTSQTGHNFKQYPDSFVHSSQALQAPHLLSNINGDTNVPAANKGFNPHTHFSGGIQLTSQTPFGPHIPVNMPTQMTNGLNNASNGNVTQSSVPSTGSSIATGQEEISTIFVVGFPDDMQEREFQNMFTFSQGFEAATLKIPNKDNTNYAGTGRPYGASGDPFNLVAPNQGTGGVVDSGRDGNWPGDESSVIQFGNNGSAPPRKQIIGFAKFRTRRDALIAKDLLQGKRIDMEKGAVLKAEMAKKNLHTKRGVGTMSIHAGPPSVAAGTTSMTGMTSNFGVYQQSNVNGFSHGPDPYTANGVDSLGASNGLSLKRINQTLVHETSHNILREEDETRRREGGVNSIGFGSMTIRGPRADEEERERRKDKEFRLRNGAPAFDPFNNFQPQSYADISRPSVNTNLRSAIEVNGSAQYDIVGPWDNVKTISAQQTPARSTSPTLSAPQLPTSTLDVSLTVERRASSGPRYPGGESESQSDGDYYTTKANEMSESFNALSLSTTAGDTSPQLPSPASNASSSVSRSIDQNPPINTLYVGNLPSGIEQLEERLRELFIAQPGFRRLCFRQKNNGPMCFVEFDDVNFATKALNTLHSHTLDGLVKGTGIRLSYSKNPLGVRTPTSAGGLMQQQQLQHAVDALQSRSVDDPLQSKSCTVRRDANPITSPPVTSGTQSSFGNSFLASPPPRFYSSSPSTLTSFTSGTSLQPIPGSSFPRNSASNILNLYNPPLSFAPFGFPSTSVANIPNPHSLPSDEQNSANSHTVQQHYHRVMSPPTVNLEAARAG